MAVKCNCTSFRNKTKKKSLWRAFLPCFEANTNTLYISRQFNVRILYLYYNVVHYWNVNWHQKGKNNAHFGWIFNWVSTAGTGSTSVYCSSLYIRRGHQSLVYPVSTNTLTGQKYFPTKIFPYIFHIKPLIFITFSWSYSLADFHEIFTFNSRIIRVYFNIFM